MAQGRQRPARSRRPAQSARGGVPWLWLAVLVLIGSAVLAARTLGRQNGIEPRPAEPTLTAPVAATSTPVARTAEPAAAPVATSRPGAVPTAAPKRATPAVPTPTVAPTRTAIPVAAAPTATVGGVNAQRTGVGSVALTFDAGADRGYAEDILDILQEEHVQASFGVTGNWAKANPDLVRRMAADGHLVFNHTLNHRSFTGVSDGLGGLSAAARRAELDDADTLIAPLIGHSTRPLYRLPYGDDDARVAGDVASAGYTRRIGWTVDSLGWRGLQSADIVARCLKLAAPGAVYVFHVGRASHDAVALPQIIHALRDRGYSFQSVNP